MNDLLPKVEFTAAPMKKGKPRKNISREEIKKRIAYYVKAHRAGKITGEELNGFLEALAKMM